jgi:predicted esterase
MRNTNLLIGALAAAGAAVLLSGKKSGKSYYTKPTDCPEIDSGSTYEYRGVRFKEYMKGGASRDEAVPMVFAFHSMGGNPTQYLKQLSGIGPARVISPFGKYRSSDIGGTSKTNFHWFPSGIKKLVQNSTEQEAGQIFLETSNWFRDFAAAIHMCRPTVGKPVFTGSSMGAEMAYLMNTTMPGFAGLTVAVNGFIPKALWSPRISPQLALHGTKDNTVPYDWDKEYNETIKAQGAPVTFSSYDAGHSLSSAMSRDWQSAIKSYGASAMSTA